MDKFLLLYNNKKMLYNNMEILQKYNSITKLLNIYYNYVIFIDIFKIIDKIYNIACRGNNESY